MYQHNINGLFFPWTQCVFSEVRTDFFCGLDVMLQFVPNYLHVAGEKFVSGSFRATENNVETLYLPQIFLKSSVHLGMCQKRQRPDFNRQTVSTESFGSVILCLHTALILLVQAFF
jgi:hypothetical protein